MTGKVHREPAAYASLGRAVSLLVSAPDGIEPHRLIGLVAQGVEILGGASPSVWLADVAKRSLVRIDPARQESVPIDGSVAGRCFITSEVVEVEGDDGRRIWVPLLTGVDRVGVLEVADAEGALDIAALERFASVVASELVTSNQYTDHFTRARRQRPMTLAAELQWASLPPASFGTDTVRVAGMVEPAYEVGGDAFDYACSDELLSVGIFDAVGHNLESSIISSLALGAYRHGRRHERSLLESAAGIDAVIRDQLGEGRFVTGQIGELDIASGRFRWLNAGHPLPLLIRQGRVVGPLHCAARPPFGFDHFARGRETEVAEEQLEPGDAILLYSDGVIERRSASGPDFGMERLGDLLQNAFAAQVSPPETLRRLANAVLDFHGGRLDDDASTLLVVWDGTSS